MLLGSSSAISSTQNVTSSAIFPSRLCQNSWATAPSNVPFSDYLSVQLTSTNIDCLQVAITTPEGRSWGYPYIKDLSLRITHPAQERLATPSGSTSPTLLEQWFGFFYVPQEPNKWECCEMWPTVSVLNPNRLQMSLQRKHFLLSYFETLSVGPAGVPTRDLPLSRLALSQLSWPGDCQLHWYTAISREVVGKNVHATIPKGNMGYDQYTVLTPAAFTLEMDYFQSSLPITVDE